MYQAKSGVKNFSLYWGWGGGPSVKIFFSSLNMYQAKSGVKNFSLYWGGGGGRVSLCEKFFFQSEHVSSQMVRLKILHFTPCCLSSLFHELWPFENHKMYRNVLKDHFSNGQNSLENVSINLRIG